MSQFNLHLGVKMAYEFSFLLKFRVLRALSFSSETELRLQTEVRHSETRPAKPAGES